MLLFRIDREFTTNTAIESFSCDASRLLLLSYGDMGFHIGIKYVTTDGAACVAQDDVSMLE